MKIVSGLLLVALFASLPAFAGSCEIFKNEWLSVKEPGGKTGFLVVTQVNPMQGGATFEGWQRIITAPGIADDHAIEGQCSEDNLSFWSKDAIVPLYAGKTHNIQGRFRVLSGEIHRADGSTGTFCAAPFWEFGWHPC